METESLGLIETLGLVGAIEAADAGTKAANVSFRGYERGRAGLITVVFTGDVAAVRTAVAAGMAAAKQVGQVVSVHVIARPHVQLNVGSTVSRPMEREPAPPPPSGLTTEPQLTRPESDVPKTVVTDSEPTGAPPQQTDAEPVAVPTHTAVAVAEVEIVERAAERSADDWPDAATAPANGDSPVLESTEEPEPVTQRSSAHKKVRKAKLRKKD